MKYLMLNTIAYIIKCYIYIHFFIYSENIQVNKCKYYR